MNSEINLEHIASLARLSLPKEGREKLCEQMKSIIEMCETLPPCDGVLSVKEKDRMELRPDEVRPSLPRTEIMASAPKTEAGCYVVPKTVVE